MRRHCVRLRQHDKKHCGRRLLGSSLLFIAIDDAALLADNLAMWQGNLIVFEGIDGAGKATQVKLLAKRLRKEGHTVTVFDFPDYSSEVGKIIGAMLRGRYGDPLAMSPYLVSILYSLDRALAADKIRAARKRGIVISNRYTSSVAYQGAKLAGRSREKLFRFVESLEFKDLSIPKPSLILYLDISVEEAQKHIVRKKKDRHERDASYQKKVAGVYRAMARQKGWKIIRVARNDAPEAVFARVWDAVRKT
ncbi:MAG: Thymidylate kinase [Parcubacteria group bacterium GW2011_GWA2_51_10]|nr:MAG: Thymidylate kinase [Parcubacteria group bacterium GW2011_GWA2_51_10]